jgi:hypothetical protein
MVGGVITKVLEWVGADKVKVLVDRAGRITEELVKYQLYTVKEGDSLEAIALAHGCCDWDLIKLNEQRYEKLKENPNYLKVNMRLAIPRFGRALRI